MLIKLMAVISLITAIRKDEKLPGISDFFYAGMQNYFDLKKYTIPMELINKKLLNFLIS